MDLDSANFRPAGVVEGPDAQLTGLGVYLYYLPPYSPELNRIEPVFRQVKHQEIPQRSHTTRAEAGRDVEQSFNNNFGERLRPICPRELRPAA